jgi:hypothetical protein
MPPYIHSCKLLLNEAEKSQGQLDETVHKKKNQFSLLSKLHQSTDSDNRNNRLPSDLITQTPDSSSHNESRSPPKQERN